MHMIFHAPRSLAPCTRCTISTGTCIYSTFRSSEPRPVNSTVALGRASAYYGPFPIPAYPWNRYLTTSVQVCGPYHQLKTPALLLYTRLAEKRRSYPGELTVARWNNSSGNLLVKLDNLFGNVSKARERGTYEPLVLHESWMGNRYRAAWLGTSSHSIMFSRLKCSTVTAFASAYLQSRDFVKK